MRKDYMLSAKEALREVSTPDTPEEQLWHSVIATAMCDMAGRVYGGSTAKQEAKHVRQAFLWLFGEDFIDTAEKADCQPSSLLTVIVDWVRKNAKERE